MWLQKTFVRLQIAVFAFFCIQLQSTLTSSTNDDVEYPPLRLPNTTFPTKYHLHITTHIHLDILRYTGNVTIDLGVNNTTDEIVLHAKDFEDVIVNLIDLNNNQLFSNVPYRTENLTSFLIISSPIELKTGQKYRLEILFLGGIRLKHFGFYRTTYSDELNNIIPLASTQFEPTSARLAFPCFDEPAFKAKFKISVTHGNNYTALSNMPIEGTPILNSDGAMATTTFQETPIMSTYLIAFVVSNYEHISELVNGIEHRVFFPPHSSKDHGKKALKNAIASVTALENYLGIKYPLPKLDHFPLDKTYGLAMENWGIITYNKRNLISSTDGAASLATIKMTGVQNHEIAHQWFGNLVSPKWWTYAWLNEGFATYFGYITTELVHPEWKVKEYFIQKEVNTIMQWPVTHSMTKYVEKEADIKATFDIVCYQKSASVIKMFHHAIGLKTFIKGVALFLTTFKYSVADEDDLFGALQTAIDEDDQNIFYKNSQGIASIMRAWTLNQGIPMITVIRNYENGTITFRQRSNSRQLDEQWSIPLSFATASNPDFDHTETNYILPPHKELTVSLEDIRLNISNNEWLIVNKQQTGVFFVNYDDRNLGLIAEALNTDYQKIHMLNRALLFRDLAEFIDKDVADMNPVLAALQYLKYEQEFMPWNSACDLILDLVTKLHGSTALETFKDFVRDTVGDVFHRVHLSIDTDLYSATTEKILEVACTVDLPECLEYTKNLAKDLFFNGQEINNSARDTILCQGIKHSTTDEFQQLLAKMVSPNTSSDTYDDIIYTIRCIESTENIKYFLDFLLGENSTFDAMSEFEKMQYVSFLYNSNYISRPVIMHFMLENYKSLFKTSSVVEYSLTRIANFVSEDNGQKDEFLMLLANIKEYFLETAKIEDLKIGSRVKQNEHFRRKHEKTIYAWTNERERMAELRANSAGSSKIRSSLTASARYIVAAGFLSNLVNFVSIKTTSGLTEEANVTKGVPQGDPSSALLFNLYYINDLEEFLRIEGLTGIDISETTNVILIAYADDIAVFAQSELHLRKTLKSLEKYFIAKDMTLNTEKSKISNTNVQYRCNDCISLPIVRLLSKVNELFPVIDALCKKVDLLDSSLNDINNNIGSQKGKNETHAVVVNEMDNHNVPNPIDNDSVQVHQASEDDVYATASAAEVSNAEWKTKGKRNKYAPHSSGSVSNKAVVAVGESKKVVDERRADDGNAVASNTDVAFDASVTAGVVVVEGKKSLDSDGVVAATVVGVHTGGVVANTMQQRKELNVKTIRVVGTDCIDDTNAEIDVINPYKWLHISKFSALTSEESIKKYVAAKINCDKGEIKCFKLVKQDTNVNDLAYVTFKIGFPVHLFDVALNPLNWPKNVLFVAQTLGFQFEFCFSAANMAQLQLITIAVILLAVGGIVQTSRIPPLFQNHHASLWEDIQSIESKADEPDYRLPNSTSPNYYYVKLTTNVHKGDKDFKGEVTINITVNKTANAKDIVIHARQLTDFDATLIDEAGSTKKLTTSYESATEFLTLTPEDKSTLAKGKTYNVVIKYNGKLREDNGGFYLSTYTNSAGNIVNLATTQFESTDARHAFPCYDEPAKRANFTIEINHDRSLNAISNMPVDTVLSKPGKTIFEQTPKMPTYLVAFVVSDFETTSGSLNQLTQRIFSRKGTQADQEFALFAGIQITARLADYYDVPFTLPKLDQVAVPDFAAGAMENWGIATYREEYLLYNPKKSTLNTQTNIANIIAHEYTHMWFGDLVTPKWWTYLWLKEGFATLYSYQAADEVYPEWDIMQMFIVSEFQKGLSYDGGANPRPMSHYVQKPSEIRSLYDSVSYSKAGAVLYMWEQALTDEVFRAGLNNYLKKHEFTAAEEDDLFNAIATAAKQLNHIVPDTINKMMKTWTNQGGVPLVTVTRNYENGSVNITQNAFHTDSKLQDNKLWYIPMNYATKNRSDFRNTTAEFYLKDRSVVIKPENVTSSDWFILNKQSTGYYRVNYDEKNWDLITDSLIVNPFKIHTLNRASLLYDAYSLSSSSHLKHEVILRMTLYLKNEDQYAPWSTANTILTVFNRFLSGDKEYPVFRVYVADVVGNIYNRLGVQYYTGEQHFTNNVRTIAINLACIAGVQSCLDDSLDKLKGLVHKGTEIEPNLQAVIYCNGLKNAGDSEFEYVYKRLMTSVDQAERKTLISSLGCSHNSTLLKKFVESSISKSDDVTLRVQERITLLSSAYSRGEVGLFACIDFLTENYEEYADLTSGFGGSNPLDSDIRGMSSYVVNKNQEARLLALVNKVKNHPDVSKNLESSVQANIKANSDWLDSNRDPVMKWVVEHYKSSAGSIFGSIIPAIIAMCYVIVRLF
ncbi:uncharacterized protein LOC129942349 [Eupeodes corollae]|uniref:uncharacterized protein LOC129942349 n=1 Tax=Eupeodes corollae TaxID=290404 RepID=UPI002491BBEC|nr:uncharacterized protein LOC129942349 [Eupeodes corollae]